MNENGMPENGKLKDNQPILLKFAPAWKRIAAYLIDILFLYIIEVFMISMIFSKEIEAIYTAPGDIDSKVQLMINFFGGYSTILFVAVFVVQAAYFTLMWFGGNQTFGMKILKIAVIDVANRKLGFFMCLLRYVIIFLSAQLFYIPLIFTINPEFRQRLHDFITGTVVVEIPSREELERSRMKDEEEAEHIAE